MTSSLSRFAAALLLSLSVCGLPLHAAEVASANLEITGSSLEVAAETTTAPDVPASLQTTFAGRTNDATVGAGFTVLGDLTGPGLNVPLTISARPGFAFSVPPLHEVGDYTLANIRLADTAGRFVQPAVPSFSVIHVAQVLSTQVRVRQLSADELRQRGITVDARNFDVYEYTFIFGVDGSKSVSIPYPVIVDRRTHEVITAPTPAPFALPPLTIETPPRFSPPATYTVILADTPEDVPSPGTGSSLPGDTAVPKRPQIPAAIVIPTGFGVLHQFYGDAYGDAPRYLQGPVVERMTFAANHSGATLTNVTVTVSLSDDIASQSIANGVRLVVLDGSNAVVDTPGTLTFAEPGHVLTWTIPAATWESLTSNPAAKTLEIAVTDQLRATAWASTPVSPAPDWALKLFPGTASTASRRVVHRESLSTLASYADGSTTHTLYEIPDLYLAATETSATHLFTGFHAAPFIEPANGMAYFRHRWYDPATGNWLTADPLGNIDSSNLYAFVGGDPVNGRDPSGNADGHLAGLLTDSFSIDPAALDYYVNRGNAWLEQKIESIANDRTRGIATSIRALPQTIAIAGLTRANPGALGAISLLSLTQCHQQNFAAHSPVTHGILGDLQLSLTSLEDCFGYGALTRAFGRDLYTARQITVPQRDEAQGRVLGAFLHFAVFYRVMQTPQRPGLVPSAGPRDPILIDADALVKAAERGDHAALLEITGGPTYVLPAQMGEFLHGSLSPAQLASRRAFLANHGVTLLPADIVAAAEQTAEYQIVFNTVAGARHSLSDAALAATARATGITAVTAERRLSNVLNNTYQKLGVPIRRVGD